MGILITVALAIIGGLCALAFQDMVAFKRLARAARPVLRYVNTVAFGSLVAALYIGADTGRAAQVTDVAIIAIVCTMAVTIVLVFLIWLREGVSGFVDL